MNQNSINSDNPAAPTPVSRTNSTETIDTIDSPIHDDLTRIYKLTPSPPLGWNSYDAFLGDGTKYDSANEWSLTKNIEVFIDRLKPAGYEYFVLDCRWFAPAEDKSLTELDEYGRSLPSKNRFPRGLTPLIDLCHKHDIKFGLHLLRGIPAKAIRLNTKVKGTHLRAKDIHAKHIIHRWDVMESVDLQKEGGQEYYNSVIELLAEWGVDFIKYDEIVRFKEDIIAVAKAIAQCGRPMVLSLSPGDWAEPENMEVYRYANMLRISGDIWDERESIIKSFEQWEKFQNYGGEGFWIDLDMIPFGHLCVPYPQLPGVDAAYGYERHDRFNENQRRTFITQRALCASPLMMGGNLPTTDDESFELITNKEMLRCNQNGITGILQHREGVLDIWKTPQKDNSDFGWIGIFNRSENTSQFKITKKMLDLELSSHFRLFDIWNETDIADIPEHQVTLDADDVLFLKYARVVQS